MKPEAWESLKALDIGLATGDPYIGAGSAMAEDLSFAVNPHPLLMRTGSTRSYFMTAAALLFEIWCGQAPAKMLP